MSQTIADFFRPQVFTSEATPITTASSIRGKIREISDPFWPYPDADEEEVELHYAIYVEPASDGSQQPFASLAPRFYFVFRLGWLADPAVWTYYHSYQLSGGSIVGDPSFPNLNSKSFEIGSIVGHAIIDTAVPGELAVAFEQGISPGEAKQKLADASPNFQVIEVVSVPGNLYLTSCRPFAEAEDGKTIESIPGVRYAQPNLQVSLVAPGGNWKVHRLI